MCSICIDVYNIACEAGKYGRNCLQNCGHCKERDQCHYVDGFCVEGCSAGFNGSRCIERKQYSLSMILMKIQLCSMWCEMLFCLFNCSLYIIIQLLKEMMNSFAACNNNFYGINCSQRCDTSCVNYACHHETGECLTQEQVLFTPFFLDWNVAIQCNRC